VFYVFVSSLSVYITPSIARLFNGKLLDGPRVNELLQLLIEALNRDSIIDVPSIFRAMEQQRLVAAKDAAFAKLEQLLDALQVSSAIFEFVWALSTYVFFCTL